MLPMPKFFGQFRPHIERAFWPVHVRQRARITEKLEAGHAIWTHSDSATGLPFGCDEGNVLVITGPSAKIGVQHIYIPTIRTWKGPIITLSARPIPHKLRQRSSRATKVCLSGYDEATPTHTIEAAEQEIEALLVPGAATSPELHLSILPRKHDPAEFGRIVALLERVFGWASESPEPVLCVFDAFELWDEHLTPNRHMQALLSGTNKARVLIAARDREHLDLDARQFCRMLYLSTPRGRDEDILLVHTKPDGRLDTVGAPNLNAPFWREHIEP